MKTRKSLIFLSLSTHSTMPTKSYIKKNMNSRAIHFLLRLFAMHSKAEIKSPYTFLTSARRTTNLLSLSFLFLLFFYSYSLHHSIHVSPFLSFFCFLYSQSTRNITGKEVVFKGLAKSSFGFLCKMVWKKPERNFWPTQYIVYIIAYMVITHINERRSHGLTMPGI